MPLPRFPEISLCEPGACSIYKEGAWPDCAKAPTTGTLHPRFMAEEICSHALARRLRLRGSQAQQRTAWDATEYALTLSEHPSDAEAFFGYAEDIFLDTFMNADKALSIVNAQIGVIFMPAYRARYAHEQLPRRALATIYGSIADALQTFDELYDPNGLDKYAGVKPELVTLALFARLGSFDWLAYPASPREENTTLTRFNHDSYVIRGDVKVPIQVKRKSGRGYDDTVAVVRLHKIIQRVNEERLRRTVQAWGNKRKITKPLQPLGYDDFARLIVRESRGDVLSDHEGRLLEFGSMVAVREVMEAEQIIRAERRLAPQPFGEIEVAA